MIAKRQVTTAAAALVLAIGLASAASTQDVRPGLSSPPPYSAAHWASQIVSGTPAAPARGAANARTPEGRSGLSSRVAAAEPVRVHTLRPPCYEHNRQVYSEMNRLAEEFRRQLNRRRPDRARIAALKRELARLADQLC